MDALLMRVSEAAAVLRLSSAKVYALIASGELPSVRVGRSVRVPEAALRDWVRQRTREGADACGRDLETGARRT